MVITFKQRCIRCRKNLVEVTSRTRYALCYDCQKAELEGEIKDAKMKKLFDIPEKFYEENSFLRSIKINYLRYGRLSDRQIEYFKKTVDGLKKSSSA